MRRSFFYLILGTGLLTAVYFLRVHQLEKQPANSGQSRHGREASVYDPGTRTGNDEEQSFTVLIHPDMPSWPMENQSPASISPPQLSAPSHPEYLAWSDWAAKPEFREVKNIHPPIHGLEPPATATLVDPLVIREGGVLALGMGSFLHLPPDAMIDASGKPVDEPVKISYCPLTDPVDIYLSGVPMGYDSAGTTSTFRTAGMFRLEATTYDGRQVQLKPGKEMRLDMPTIDSADTYNFYAFNEKEGGWEWKRPAPPARPKIELIMDTMDVDYDFDTNSFATKFDDLNYHGLIHSRFQKSERYYGLRRTFFNRHRALTENNHSKTYTYRKTRLIKLKAYQIYKGQDENHKPVYKVRFNITFYGQAYELFPEIRSLGNQTFLADDCRNIREFYSRYFRGKRYHDIRLNYSEGDEHCEIVLKDEKEFVRIPARIAFGKHRVSGIQERLFARKYARYQNTLGEKQVWHDETVKRKKKEFILRNIVSSARGFVNLYQSYRQISLPGFATYNCDQIARMRKPEKILTHYLRPDGTKIIPDVVTVYDNVARASFYFDYAHQMAPTCSKGGFRFALISDGENHRKYAFTRNMLVKGQFPKSCVLIPIPEKATDDEIRNILNNGYPN